MPYNGSEYSLAPTEMWITQSIRTRGGVAVEGSKLQLSMLEAPRSFDHYSCFARSPARSKLSISNQGLHTGRTATWFMDLPVPVACLHKSWYCSTLFMFQIYYCNVHFGVQYAM